MKKKIAAVLTKILTICLIAALLLTLCLNVSTLLAVAKIQRGGMVTSGFYCAIIGSGSMEPAVSVNDLLIVRGNASYQAGDIITYVSPRGALVTHRLKAVSGEGYIAQGDANNIPDDEITAQRVLGKLVYCISGFGDIIDAILSPIGIILLVCLFLLVWLMERMKKDRYEYEREET